MQSAGRKQPKQPTQLGPIWTYRPDKDELLARPDSRNWALPNLRADAKADQQSEQAAKTPGNPKAAAAGVASNARLVALGISWLAGLLCWLVACRWRLVTFRSALFTALETRWKKPDSWVAKQASRCVRSNSEGTLF